MHRYIKILLLLFLITSQLSSGQAILRSSISCFGSTYTDVGLILRQTAGQSSSTEVLKDKELVLRQGFQQPLAPMDTFRELAPLDFAISPNPAKDLIRLRFMKEIPRCVISIWDMNGHPLHEYISEGVLSKWLDLKVIKPGVYIITVASDDSFGSKKLIITE